MSLLFFVFAAGALVAIPIHFMSVEHTKLQEKYGPEKGAQIGERYGRISGDLLFFSLIGLWLSPQPQFTLPILPDLAIRLPINDFSIPLIHLIIALPFIAAGVWFLFQSVTGLSRKVSEQHHPEKVISAGIYARVRHPQHLGFLLVHVGFAVLLSGWYALLATPIIFAGLYLIARKEETELTKEFGADYVTYRGKVPMLFPRFGRPLQP